MCHLIDNIGLKIEVDEFSVVKFDLLSIRDLIKRFSKKSHFMVDIFRVAQDTLTGRCFSFQRDN